MMVNGEIVCFVSSQKNVASCDAFPIHFIVYLHVHVHV